MYAPLFTQARHCIGGGANNTTRFVYQRLRVDYLSLRFSSEGLLALSILQSVRGKELRILKG